MNRFLHFIGIIGTMIMIICDIAEFLAVPALFIVIGLLNSYPWQYYAISIGGYIVLFIVAEIIAHFVFKALDKKYTPLIERKLEKYLNKFPYSIELSESEEGIILKVSQTQLTSRISYDINAFFIGKFNAKPLNYNDNSF